MDLTETLRTSGSGVNGTIGIIARPINAIQIGLSYNSPTWYHTVSDSYQGTMTTQWNNFDYFGDGTTTLNSQGDQTDVVVTNYSMTTPSRLNLGGTVFAGKNGFITADVEFVNYSGGHINSGYSDYDAIDNGKIKDTYQSTINYRGGGEYRFKSFRVRAGYSYMSDPYRVPNDPNAAISSISGGLGYRGAKFYLDLAIVNSSSNSTYSPYDPGTSSVPVVFTKNSNNMLMVTFGFPFQK
jgi:hypothetical protein